LADEDAAEAVGELPEELGRRAEEEDHGEEVWRHKNVSFGIFFFGSEQQSLCFSQYVAQTIHM
jgi:hypothetical protein